MAVDRRSSIRGDLIGGLVSAGLAAPLAIGYGMFAFTVLGDDYFAYGALAGLYSAIIAGLICPLLGDKSTIVYAPRVTTTFLLGSLLYQLAHVTPDALSGNNLSVTILAFFLLIFLGGILQFFFGLIRLGSLIRFMPQPVFGGLQNAAAALLFLVQLGNVFGFDRNIPFTAVAAHLSEVKPLSICVAALTSAVMWNARRLSIKVPPLLVGLIAGTALYFFLHLTGFGPHLGPVIGAPVAPEAPRPSAALRDVGDYGRLLQILPIVLIGGLGLAITSAVDALLCAKLALPKSAKRINPDYMLIRLGLSNAVSACFGGITAGVNIGPSVSNRAFGATTSRSGLINAFVLLAVATFGFPMVSYIPRVVLSAAIMVIAVQHIDPWSTDIIRRLRSGGAHFTRWIIFDLFVMSLVAALSVTINIAIALFAGIFVAAGLFIVRMSRSVIRRRYAGDRVHSRKARTPEDAALLERRGSEILVLELQGVVFFGSGELLSDEIDRYTFGNLRTVILDLRRVTEIDATGARILADIYATLATRNQRMILACPKNGEIAVRIVESGLAALIGHSYIFDDVDRALECAEDGLIRSLTTEVATGEGVNVRLASFDLFSALTADELEILEQHMPCRSFQPGMTVFIEGAPGHELFVVMRGHASAYLKQAGAADIRLATFAPGTIFGELAILDAGPRSATIIADDELSCLVLDQAQFALLTKQAPSVAIKVLASLGRELSQRLRRANRTIHELEA